MTQQFRALSLLSFAIALPLMAAQPIIRPGLWEITITTELPMKTPPSTVVQCLTKEEIKRLDVPRGKSGDDCKASGARSGTSLDYSVSCSKRPRTSTARFTFTADTYDGVVTVKENSMEIRQVFSARRIADCEQPEEGARP